MKLEQAAAVSEAVAAFGKKRPPRCADDIVSAYVTTMYPLHSPEWWVKWHELCDMVSSMAGGQRKRKVGGGPPRKGEADGQANH